MLLTEEDKKSRWEAAYAGDADWVPKNLRRATLALFWEYRHQCRWKQRGITPLFNLSMKDHDDTLSFPQLYFQCSSDYEAAMVILGSWQQWERLMDTNWFPERLEKWKEEKVRRDAAFGHAKIKELAEKGNLAACKLLASGGIDTTPKSPKKKPEPKPEQEQPVSAASDDTFLEHGMNVLDEEKDES